MTLDPDGRRDCRALDDRQPLRRYALDDDEPEL